jgi:hypothetical protein
MCYHLAHRSLSLHRRHLRLLAAIARVLVLVPVRHWCLVAENLVVSSRWEPHRGGP